MKSIKILFSIGVLFLALGACQKSDDLRVKRTTPYTLEVPKSLPRPALPADNPLTVEGVALGKKLFYDPILSIDSTISCGSCHHQAAAFSDNGNAFSIGIDGNVGKRTSMPLMNLAFHPHFFWDGRSPTLRALALEPIIDPLEMGNTLENMVKTLNRHKSYLEAFQVAFGAAPDAELVGLAIEQFLLTILSGQSKFDQVQLGLATFTPEEARGFAIFNAEGNPSGPLRGGDCFHCHNTALFSTFDLINNGMEGPTDKGLGDLTGDIFDYFKFKTPSLRNVEVSAPYMHDGRFTTLEEVLEHYDFVDHANVSISIDPNMHASMDGLQLTAQDKADLVAFLKTLTDHNYLNNPAFANPFE